MDDRGGSGSDTINRLAGTCRGSPGLDIDFLVREYKKFHANYDKGDMNHVRRCMKQLQHNILAAAEVGADRAADVGAMNDEYNSLRKVYHQLIDAYFPFTAAAVPRMMELLHDDKFNNFDPAVYRDVLETFDGLTSGRLAADTVAAKVDNMVRQAVPANRSAAADDG